MNSRRSSHSYCFEEWSKSELLQLSPKGQALKKQNKKISELVLAYIQSRTFPFYYTCSSPFSKFIRLHIRQTNFTFQFLISWPCDVYGLVFSRSENTPWLYMCVALLQGGWLMLDVMKKGLGISGCNFQGAFLFSLISSNNSIIAH